MIDRYIYKVFHENSDNLLRNYSYSQISDSMSPISVLDSETIFLKTKDDCINFISGNESFSVNTIKNYTGEGTVFPPRAGVLGILASNYLAWKKFLTTDKDYLVLFEDDVVVSRNIKNLLNKYISELPDDWDVFSFYIPNDIKHLYSSVEHDLPEKQFVCKSYTTHCCAAYVVSRSGAEKAISDIESKGVSAPLDWYVLNVKHLGTEPDIFNVYCLKPDVYMPVKEIPEEYYSTVTHYGKTEEFDPSLVIFGGSN